MQLPQTRNAHNHYSVGGSIVDYDKETRSSTWFEVSNCFRDVRYRSCELLPVLLVVAVAECYCLCYRLLSPQLSCRQLFHGTESQMLDTELSLGSRQMDQFVFLKCACCPLEIGLSPLSDLHDLQ